MSGSFRTMQAVSDLVHHVKPLLAQHLAAVAEASGLGLRETGEAFARLRDDGFRFQRDETLPLLNGLETIAITQAEGFDLAVVVLLADVLQRGQASGLLAEAWDEACKRLRDWPATLRAAVANGLVRASKRYLIHLEMGPTHLDCLTRGGVEVSEHLLQIARSLRRHELEAISRADYGMNADAYLDALIDTLARRSGVFPTEGVSPYEVVNLTSFDTKSQAFAGCTALILLNCLKTGSCDGFHWEEYGAVYCGLKPSQRDAILAGIRHIYETDVNFLHLATVDLSRLGEGATIPVVDDL